MPRALRDCPPVLPTARPRLLKHSKAPSALCAGSRHALCLHSNSRPGELPLRNLPRLSTRVFLRSSGTPFHAKSPLLRVSFSKGVPFDECFALMWVARNFAWAGLPRGFPFLTTDRLPWRYKCVLLRWSFVVASLPRLLPR